MKWNVNYLFIAAIWVSLMGIMPKTMWSQSPQEKLFVHTDKSLYVIGETLWFSAYCLEVQGSQLIDFSKVAYLELLNGTSQAVLQEKISLKEGRGKGQFFISPDIPSGVYYLRAYTAWMKNQGPESFFEQALCIINPQKPPTFDKNEGRAPFPSSRRVPSTDELLRVSLPQKQFKQREKVQLILTSSLEPLDFKEINLSLSIHKVDSSLYFPRKTLSSIASHQTQDSVKTLSYSPESITPLLQGRIAPPPDSIPIFLNFPGKTAEMYEIAIGEGGVFTLPLSPRTPSGDMLFWSPEDELSETEIDIYSPYSTETRSMEKVPFPDSSWRSLIEAYSFNAQVGNIYLEETKLRGKVSSESRYELPFYGIPRYSYRLDEYTRFPKLEEVFLEYIRFGLKRKIGDKRYVFIWDEYANASSMGNSIPFSQPALTLIDGIPVKDPEFIWDFDVFEVEQIDLVTKMYLLGDYPFYGIANFITYKHNFGGQGLPNYVIRKNHQGLQQAREFYSPDYSTDENLPDAIPDFRSTLYWDPLIKMDQAQKEISFWTSDDAGTYKIEIHGLSGSGTPIYMESYFTVSATDTYE